MSTQTMIASDELFIGGEWIKPQGSDRISVLAASTEEPVGSVPDGTNGDIDAAVKAARQASEDPSGWSSWSNEDRARARRTATIRRSDPLKHARIPAAAFRACRALRRQRIIEFRRGPPGRSHTGSSVRSTAEVP